MQNKILALGFIYIFCLKSLVLHGQPVTDVVATTNRTSPAFTSLSLQQTGTAGSSLSSNITGNRGTSADTVILPKTGGAIYIRAAAPAGNPPAHVVSSPGGITRPKLRADATVKALSANNTVTNQTVASGSLTAPVNFPVTGCLYTWANSNPGIGLAASGTGNIPAFTAINTGNSPVTATVTVNPVAPGGFAYIPDGYSDKVWVIATATNTVITSIPVGDAPDAESVSPDGNRVYVANDGANTNVGTVSVISTATNTVIATIPVGLWPTGLVVSPDGTKLYVSNSGAETISVISTANNSVVSSIPLNIQPENITISPDGNTLYVNNGFSANPLSVISVASGTATNIATGKNATQLAITPNGNFLYVINSLSSNPSNSISVINTITKSLLTTINIGSYLEGLVISPDGKKAYVTDFNGSKIYVINTSDNTVSATIATPAHPSAISITPDGTNIYVIDDANSVEVINTANFELTRIFNVPTASQGIASFVITPSVACTSAPFTFSFTVNPAGTPIITATGSPNAVNTSYGTPSSSTSFTVSGANLSAGILVTPPPGFEVSTDNINFSSTVTVGGANATGPITVYIRLAAITNAGTYSGNIVLSSNGAASVNVNMPNSIVSPAIMNITGNFSKLYGDVLTNVTLYYNTPGFTYNIPGLVNGNTFKSINFAFGIGASATDPVGTYTGSVIMSDFEGGNGFLPGNYTINYFPVDLVVLPAPITITAGNVSKPYGTALTSGLPSTNFTVSGLKNNETVGDVQISYGPGASAPSPPGLYTGSVIPSGATGGTFSPGNYTITYQPGNLNVIAPPPPVISYTGLASALQTVYGTPSAATSVQVSGINLTAALAITPPAGFEISNDNTSFGTTIALNPDGAGTITATIIYIRLAATTPVGNYTGNLVLNSTGASQTNVSLTGKVTPAALTIAATPVNKTYGTVLTGSAGSTAFTTSGLQNGETIGTITLTCGAGSAAGDPVGVYTASLVPSAATGGSFNPGNYNITYIAANITVDQASLTITADNKSRVFASPNPPLTITYTGFVNNEGPAQLTILPIIATTAVLTSPIGQYQIMVSGALSSNYAINYVNGILTVYSDPQNIKIPNAFTPNGDGINDVWNIKDLQYYSNCTVEIYNRYGQHLYQSRGYSQPWDGTYNRQLLPNGTYYYIINLNDGSQTKLSGYVVILK